MVTLIEHDMTWTKDKPSSLVLAGINTVSLTSTWINPMPTWVFDSHRLFYVQLMPVHERSNAPVAKDVKDYDGQCAYQHRT